MYKRFLIILFFISSIIFVGAGCSSVNPVKSDVNFVASSTLKMNYYTKPELVDNLSAPFDEWQKFSQPKYGWSFYFPPNWKIRTEKTDNQLLVFLSNVACDNQCPPQFVGLKMKVGLVYSGGVFKTFINKLISANNVAHIYPSGQMSDLKIGGKTAVRVAHADWSGADAGPGYFIYLDQDYYAYISTGKNNLTTAADEVIERIISSIQISRNSLARPASFLIQDNDASVSTTMDTGDGQQNNADGGRVFLDNNDAVSIYTSRRYKFTVKYPERCILSDITDQTQSPILLELSLCGVKVADHTVGVRVFDGSGTQAWKNILGQKKLHYQIQNILVADRPGKIYIVAAGTNNRAQRWLLVEKNNRTYIIYTLLDSGRYANDFDNLLTGLQFD